MTPGVSFMLRMAFGDNLDLMLPSSWWRQVNGRYKGGSGAALSLANQNNWCSVNLLC